MSVHTLLYFRVNSTATYLVLSTPRANECHVGQKLSVVVEYSGPSKQSSFFFTYQDNPVIADMEPRTLSITYVYIRHRCSGVYVYYYCLLLFEMWSMNAVAPKQLSTNYGMQ